jgi:hypothetical protein
VKFRIYVEGGGDSNALKTKCREGFRRFFQSAGLSGHMPAVVACGSRNNAFDSFQTAIAAPKHGEIPLLLVDSETSISNTPWNHLQSRDGWNKPKDADNKHAQLMVQCMEAWFIADTESLAKYFGQHFNPNALPANQQVETIAKSMVLKSLKDATRNCTPKGAYRKGKHSFEVLGQIDASKVRQAAPHADRLLKLLEAE